jgi:competence protein ComEC
MASPSPRAPTAWLLLPLICGYLSADSLPVAPAALAVAGTILALAATGFAHLRQRWAFPIWATAACAAGTLLAAAFYQHRMSPPADWVGLPPREAHLTLEISRLYGSPDLWQRQRGIAQITQTEPHLRELLGRRVYFSGRAPDEEDTWKSGTRLHLTGILERIEQQSGEEDDFTRFLLRSGIHFRLTRTVHRIPPEPPRGLKGFFAAGHERIEHLLRLGSTDENRQTNIHVAMFLGKRAELSAEQRTSFLQTGTLHLFAISGLHIGVIAVAIHTFLTLLRIPSKLTALIGVTCLFCFVGITGASPSAVRAFLMVVFFWSARVFLRAPNPIAALANSAVFVLLLFPAQLWSPGFQLSYAVVAGILFLGLPLASRLQEKWVPYQDLPEDGRTRLQSWIAGGTRGFFLTFAVSLSATLLSSPLSIHHFGVFAPGAVGLNLILIPAASLVIVAGFASALTGLLGVEMVAQVFNYAAWILIAGMEGTVLFAPRIPGFFWHASFIGATAGALAILPVLGTVVLCAHQRWRAPAFHFVLPFLVFVLLLLTVGRLTFPAG